MVNLDRLTAAYEQAKRELLAERTPDGHWVGELSSSALSTATAVSALAVMRKASARRQPSEAIDIAALIDRGVGYISRQQNDDGGFGDTDLSHSNIATTYLVVAALHLAGVAEEHRDLLVRANEYIDRKGGLAGLRERYGIDKTFVVPIMMNLALAGLVDWHEIDALPFQLACVPQAWYRFVGMPVVSYAIPALVAIGQAQFHHAPPRNPLTWLIRRLSITRSLKVLRRMQPESGGYLEATPLTSFVVMSLASITKARPSVGVSNCRIIGATSTPSSHLEQSATNGRGYADDVIREGVKFLANSIRPDGSWPIDTNLATWNTTLAINALAGAGEDVAELLGPKCLDWLLSCQHTKRHPFTGADPGGFGWSDLSGGVPDADDTAGAILAITSVVEAEWHRPDKRFIGRRKEIRKHLSTRECAHAWLLKIQNRDGGWPTFCRGWGKLPFDRSGVDLTAHAIRAIRLQFQSTDQAKMIAASWAITNGQTFVQNAQHPDGSWSPLWFGNQDHPDEDNPVYGTAKVLMAYRDLELMDSPEAQRGVAWLVANQNADGGWGSGVWDRVQNAECRMRKGSGGWKLEAGEGAASNLTGGNGVRSSAQEGASYGAESSVPSTPYSVRTAQNAAATQAEVAASTDPKSEIRNPKSAIQNLTSSIEETALAVEALLAVYPLNPEPRTLNPVTTAVERGLAWLIERVEQGQHRQPAPIGFYFAKLWYYERLYPLTFTVAALGRARRYFACRQPSEAGSEREPSETRAS